MKVSLRSDCFGFMTLNVLEPITRKLILYNYLFVACMSLL